MSQARTRRGFLRAVSAGAAGLSGLRAGARARADGAPKWSGLPRLEGELLRDPASRERLAVDMGGHARRLPAAVLRPRTAQDVARVVRFANERGLKVAMRGRGHSQYGQTLVEDGIVIDSSSLDAVALVGERTVDARAGASWDALTRVTLARGLAPPAMGDSPMLSVGGILSAGGISNSSHLHGGVVDGVEELDVVTGEGELLTCSEQRHRELFELALGGMGQCGLIVGARLRLMPVPRWVVRRDLDYDDLVSFLADHRRLAAEARVEHLGAYVLPRAPGGPWRFRINIGSFAAAPDAVDFAGLQSGLRFRSLGDPVPLSFAEYVHREAARDAALLALRRTPHRGLYMSMFLPASVSLDFMARVLATPAETEGMSRFSLYVLPTARFRRPLFVLPAEAQVFNFWLFRMVPVAEERRYTELAAAVRGLTARVQAAGGKAFPPYAPFYTRADWQAHYGPVLWARLVAAKERYDPRGVLNPASGVSAAE